MAEQTIVDKTYSEKEIREGKIAAIAIAAIFFALAALTSALPPLGPLKIAVTSEAQSNLNNGDSSWVLTCSALVLLMTPGVAFFYGGMVNHKNVISTMYQSFIAMGIVSVLWVIVGFSLAFGKDANGNGIIGYPRTYFMYNGVGGNPDPFLSPTVPLINYSMFQLMFAIITPTLISGSLAERINFNSWMIFICIWHLIVYCPLAHMMWTENGILHKFGCMDFAGGTVVEMSSGYAALAGAYFLGPRSVKSHNPPNVPYILLGTALFWFGWLGFDSGSAVNAGPVACNAFATTNTAGAAGMLTWILLDKITGKPTSAVGACNGIVVGLVAATPSSGFVTVGSSMVIGVLANLVCYGVGILFKSNVEIDDTLEVFTVHGVSGTVGFLCNGIFGSKAVNPAGYDGLIYGNGLPLAKHIAVVLVMVPCILIVSYGIFWFTNLIIPMRVTATEEEIGLDMSMHNESLSDSHRSLQQVTSPNRTMQEVAPGLYREIHVIHGPEYNDNAFDNIELGPLGGGLPMAETSLHGSDTGPITKDENLPIAETSLHGSEGDIHVDIDIGAVYQKNSRGIVNYPN